MTSNPPSESIDILAVGKFVTGLYWKMRTNFGLITKGYINRVTMCCP